MDTFFFEKTQIFRLPIMTKQIHKNYLQELKKLQPETVFSDLNSILTTVLWRTFFLSFLQGSFFLAHFGPKM